MLLCVGGKILIFVSGGKYKVKWTHWNSFCSSGLDVLNAGSHVSDRLGYIFLNCVPIMKGPILLRDSVMRPHCTGV